MSEEIDSQTPNDKPVCPAPICSVPIDLPFKVKTAGHPRDLYVCSLTSHCGKIEGGVAFAFDGQGKWVIALEDLEKIVALAHYHKFMKANGKDQAKTSQV